MTKQHAKGAVSLIGSKGRVHRLMRQKMRRPRANRSLLAALVGAASIAAPQAMAQQSAGIRYADIPDGAYSVVAEVWAKPGKARELREATLPLVAKVRAEPNNLVYVLQEDRNAPGHFVFYEIFVSQADFEAHNASPHVLAWFDKLPELADGGVKAVRMEVIGSQAASRR